MAHDQYLRQHLSRYQYPDIAKRDAGSALQIYSDLRPSTEKFVFNDGSSKDLLSLEGTIPVSYKGNTYNIPVCVWLQENHPYASPMCYVKPTATMSIKSGKHVDSNGKVFLPYLHEWRHPNSDLLGLIQLLAIVFGEEPPVYSRPASQPPPPAPQYNPPAAANTPYPTQGSYMPMPGVGGGNYPGYAPSTTAGSYPPYPPPAGYAGNQAPYPPSSTAATAGGYQPPYHPYTPPQSTSTADSFQASASPQTAASRGNTLSEDQVRESLLTAVEDKMKRRLREIFAQAQAEMDALKGTKADLEAGKTRLDDMVPRLQQEQQMLTASIQTLEQRVGEARQSVTSMEGRASNMNVDDAVAPTAPLYRQILTTFAEENGTEDAIYYLGEALRRGTVELDVFLKNVRELSRKQFMQKALMIKCRSKAGLPELG